MGFEYFYGFVGGDANQWQPNLFRNTTQIYPFQGKPGWNLITGMADDAIDYMTRIHQTAARQADLHQVRARRHACAAPPDQGMGRQDQRDEAVRRRLREAARAIFENQKRLGVIPKDTKLAPWPSQMLKPWDQLTADEKKLFIRQVEVFAAYAAYSDHEIGRVIQHFEDLGKLDNTLIIYINGDNGTSAEGGPNGTPNEVAFFNGVQVPVDVQMKFYDVWGTEQTYNHMSAGWSWAFDTPFSWFKQNASAAGRRQPEHGGVVAGAHQGQGRPARAVRARHRRRADHPGGRRHQGAAGGGRHQAGADRRHQLRLHLRREERQGAAAPQDPVLRDDGPVGAVRRRLVPQHQGEPRAVGGLRPGQPRPAEQPGARSCTT